MKAIESSLTFFLRAGVLAVLAVAAPLSRGAVILWTGTPISFTHTPQNGLGDEITPNLVITRGSTGGLYNSVLESSATAGISPLGTSWAIGALSNYNTLTYSSCLLEMRHSPSQYIGTTFVVHLTNNNDDIYLSLTLTDWEGEFQSGNTVFAYTRTTAPAVSPTPSVTITNPLNNAFFAAPASVKLAASATVSSGAVTNVQFFANTTNSLGSVTAAPFNLTSGNLSAGPYALTAVATAGGISATSTAVNITVVNPVAVSLSGTAFNAGQISFNYTANPGLSYVVQGSSDFLNWTSLETNVASGNPVPFSTSIPLTGVQFYRVGRLPNP